MAEFLPLADALPQEEPREPERTAPAGGGETILLVEDDDAIRKISHIVLESAGYRLIDAADGEEAVEKFRERGGEVDLLLLDMIMPGKNGKEVYEEIERLKPGIRVIFVSGYTAHQTTREAASLPDTELLLKPVSPRDLLQKVRAVLDRRRS